MLRYLSDRIAFTDQALKVNLERLRDIWEDYQSSRDRNGIYRYLNAVFELVSWWRHYGIAKIYARRAMCLKMGRPVDHVPEPFAAIILCTADPSKADYRMRSKWSRALRYTAEFKRRRVTLEEFMKRRGGINKCAARYARCLGRSTPRKATSALPFKRKASRTLLSRAASTVQQIHLRKTCLVKNVERARGLRKRQHPY